ncbi:MAG: hypothetical protein V4513_07935 [Pseudomonadota bacterium]
MPSARDNFVRLAEARTRKLLKDFDLLGNLSNRSNYSYSEEDVKLIFRAIGKKVQETELRFKMNIQAGRDTEFKLPR